MMPVSTAAASFCTSRQKKGTQAKPMAAFRPERSTLLRGYFSPPTDVSAMDRAVEMMAKIKPSIAPRTVI